MCVWRERPGPGSGGGRAGEVRRSGTSESLDTRRSELTRGCGGKVACRNARVPVVNPSDRTLRSRTCSMCCRDDQSRPEVDDRLRGTRDCLLYHHDGLAQNISGCLMPGVKIHEKRCKHRKQGLRGVSISGNRCRIVMWLSIPHQDAPLDHVFEPLWASLGYTWRPPLGRYHHG